MVVASTLKRVGAVFIDLVLMVIIVVCLQNWVVGPISNSIYHVDQKTERYKDVILDSHLFVTYNDAIYQINSKVIYDEDKYKSVFSTASINSYDFFEPYFEKFLMTEYADNIVSDKDKDPTNNKSFKEEYAESKSNSELFTYDGDKYVPVDGVDNVALCNFYLEQYDLAYEALYNVDFEPYQLVATINAINMMGLITSLLLSITAIVLFPTLCFRNGETFGKIMLGIAVVSRKDGFRCGKLQILVRFAAFILLEVATGLVLGSVSTWLIIIPIIISFSFVVFSKGHGAIHDYCAATLVVDISKCVIFANAKELEEHNKQIELNEKRDVYYIEKNAQNEEVDNNQ